MPGDIFCHIGVYGVAYRAAAGGGFQHFAARLGYVDGYGDVQLNSGDAAGALLTCGADADTLRVQLHAGGGVGYHAQHAGRHAGCEHISRGGELPVSSLGGGDVCCDGGRRGAEAGVAAHAAGVQGG